MAIPKRLTGRWRISEMDLWDRDAIDLVGPAFIEFSANGKGQIRFIAVEGYLTGAVDKQDRTRADFTWEGYDDGDQVSGYGWVKSESDVLRGHIYFHNGDDSGFTATNPH